MYSYGWREYMPDIGRWNGIDQLAESYLSTSPYAYVANNPALMTDPDGRWMDDSGHIKDTTGQTFGLHGSSYRPLLSFSTNDGMHTNEGVGVTDNGNNRIGQGPKPNIFKRIGNFFGRLFGRAKNKIEIEIGIVEPITPYGAIEDFSEGTANFLDRYIRYTKSETFYSSTGGVNDPDKETLNKLRPGDKIETSDMLQTIFLFYGRNTKLRGGTTGFQEALVQFGLDTEAAIDLNKSSIYSILKKDPDTFGIWDRQSTGVLRNNDGFPFGFKYKNVRGQGLSKRTLDSLNKAIKDSNNYWNAQYKK